MPVFLEQLESLPEARRQPPWTLLPSLPLYPSLSCSPALVVALDFLELRFIQLVQRGER